MTPDPKDSKMPDIMAAHAWLSNAEMVADVAQLGYLDLDWPTLDPTYGVGTWWKLWRPYDLVAHDLDPDKAPDRVSTDFRALPHDDETFGAVTFDPPYKLNGTPTHEVDDRYGVAGAYTSRQDRHQLMLDGLDECARVAMLGGYVLVKCQDQVNAGAVRWQTRMLTDRAEQIGLDLADWFLMLGHRAQPPGRRQVHARRNYSSLLVFRKTSATPWTRGEKPSTLLGCCQACGNPTREVRL